MHNESLKPTRNSPGILARPGGRATYLKRYARGINEKQIENSKRRSRNIFFSLSLDILAFTF